jgi:hypothetical protein
MTIKALLVFVKLPKTPNKYLFLSPIFVVEKKQNVNARVSKRRKKLHEKTIDNTRER